METKTQYSLQDLCNANLAATDDTVKRLRSELSIEQAEKINEIYHQN